MKYIGSPMSVAQLIKLLDNLHGSAGLKLSVNSSLDYIEVWYDHEIDSVILLSEESHK
jgi:hypothetical protein